MRAEFTDDRLSLLFEAFLHLLSLSCPLEQEFAVTFVSKVKVQERDLSLPLSLSREGYENACSGDSAQKVDPRRLVFVKSSSAAVLERI